MILLFLSLAAWPALAQNGNGEVDEQTLLMQYSLFAEEYKNENFAGAAPWLKWLLDHAPADFQTRRIMDRGWKTHRGLAEVAKEAGQADIYRAHLDSALMILDMAFERFESTGTEYDKFKWTYDRGRFIQAHLEAWPEHQGRIYDDYMQLYQLDNQRVQAYYIRYVLDEIVKQDRKDEALQFMDEVQSVRPDETELLEYFDYTRNNLFDSPEERIVFLQEQLAKNGDDPEIINELFSLATRLDDYELKMDMADRLSRLDPSPRVFRILGQMKMDDGDYPGAQADFQQAIAMSDDPQLKRDLYYNMATMEQENGNLQQSRNYARQALEMDANFGRSYLLIAGLYAEAVQNCGSMEREDKAVYWLVLDYYERAKSVDPSVASQANQGLRTFRPYAPSQEDKFFVKAWQNAGAPHRVNSGCYAWINETTRVR